MNGLKIVDAGNGHVPFPVKISKHFPGINIG